MKNQFESKNQPFLLLENFSKKQKMQKVCPNPLCRSDGKTLTPSLALAALVKTTRPFLGLVSKAKAAKLVRTLVDLFLDMEAGTGEEVRRIPFGGYIVVSLIDLGNFMSRKHRMG